MASGNRESNLRMSTVSKLLAFPRKTKESSRRRSQDPHRVSWSVPNHPKDGVGRLSSSQGHLGSGTHHHRSRNHDRRQSMFARNYNPSNPMKNSRANIVVTCIPAIIRFRRAARLVRLFCKVCLVCKRNMIFKVSQNSWVSLKEALLRESDVSQKEKEQEKSKKTGLSTEDPELTFDVNKFRRHSKDHDQMPLKVRELLRKPGKLRTPEENANIMRSMQKLELFARYPIKVQKRLCSRGWFEEYEPNRVILREGHKPVCFYFVISGRLVANGEDEKGSSTTTLLKRGDKFGEAELATNAKRKATVMSQDDVCLFVVSRQDYCDICLAKGDKDMYNLDFFKKNPVFNHWPMERLIENPESWTMQNYKPGILVVEDSNRSEWLYLIKSGTCKIVKCLKPRELEDDPIRIRKLMAKKKREELLQRIESNNMRPLSSTGTDDTSSNSGLAPSSTFFTTPKSRPQTYDNSDPAVREALEEAARARTAPSGSNPFLSSLYGKRMKSSAYVALEVLGVGDSFGFLAVLPKEQRGSSVSLVSCGAELIQINRKFFQRFADETVYSLITMKFTPFPKQKDILKNLKQSFEWKDYKRRTIEDALQRLYRPITKP